MIKFLFIFLFSFGGKFLFAQYKGIVPLHGITYTRNGIWGDGFEATLDGNKLKGNKVMYGGNLEVKLLKPRGFLYNKKGKCFVGISVLVLNAKNNTIVNEKNIFAKYAQSGLSASGLKNLSYSIRLDSNKLIGDSVTHFVRFYDLKSKNELKIKFPIKMHGNHLPADTTSSSATANGTMGYTAAACGGVWFNKFEFYVDSINYPKNLYQTFRLAELEGLTTNEVKEGHFETFIYDEDLNIIPMFTLANQYAALTYKDKTVINILVQIPVNSNDAKNKKYTYRYKWQSANGEKVIDVIYKANDY